MRSRANEQLVYEEIVRWTEPSSVEERELLGFSEEDNEKYLELRKLDLPVEDLLFHIWWFISCMFEPDSDLAEGLLKFGYQKEGVFFYSAGWLLRGFVEGENPRKWYEQSCSDQLLKLMLESGFTDDDIWDIEYADVLQSLLTPKVFAEVRKALMDLAFERIKNLEGKTCAEVILGARN